MVNIKPPTNPVQNRGLWPPKSYRAVHFVADTDEWWTVARKYDVSAGDLIEFNFATRIPEEINWYLRELVGCKLAGPEGYNYSFRGADPAKRKIYIPPITEGKEKAPEFQAPPVVSVPQLALTPAEIEKFSGVSGLDTAKWFRLILTIGNGLKTLIFNVTSAGAGATAALLGTFFSVLATAVLVALAFGIPVAEAKQLVREKNLRAGFAVGVVIVILGYGKQKLEKHRLKESRGGFKPKYMQGIAEKAFNFGLAIGYDSTLKLSQSEKAALSQHLASIVIDEAKKGKYELNMKTWTDDKWIYTYSRAFEKIK